MSCYFNHCFAVPTIVLRRKVSIVPTALIRLVVLGIGTEDKRACFERAIASVLAKTEMPVKGLSALQVSVSSVALLL